MARCFLQLPILYCTIVLLIHFVSSVDVEFHPIQLPIPVTATAKPKCHCKDDFPTPESLLVSSSNAQSSFQRSELMNDPELLNTTRNGTGKDFQKPQTTLDILTPSSFQLPAESSGLPLENSLSSSFSTHSSPPATAFKAYKSTQLFAEETESLSGNVQAEGRHSLRPIFRSSDILQLGNIFEPFKGPRRRRRRRRRSPIITEPGRKVSYVYADPGSQKLNEIGVQKNENLKTPLPQYNNIGNQYSGSFQVPALQTNTGNYKRDSSMLAPGNYSATTLRNNQPTKFLNITQNLMVPPLINNYGNYLKPASTPSLNGNVQQVPSVIEVHNVQLPPSSPASNNIPRFEFHAQLPQMSLEERYGSASYDQKEVQAMLDIAMANAWAQYGPNSKPPNHYTLVPSPTHQFPVRSINDRNSAILLSPNFQPVTSEWDKQMTKTPNRQETMEPGIFNRILSTYIDFEVNNHETADLIRKMIFGFFIGLIVIGWIFLGIAIGLLPYKFFLLTSKRDVEGKDYDEGLDSLLPSSKNSIVRELTENVYLALDGDWLKKLEEAVTKNASAKWLKTNVHCCILPDAKTNGMAECQVIRKGRKASTFKCLSDLIYNFQFGPSGEPTPQ